MIILYLQVYYIHDGSEFSTDVIIFEIELSNHGSVSSLPAELQLRQRFQLQISIRPQNDVPKIELGTGKKQCPIYKQTIPHFVSLLGPLIIQTGFLRIAEGTSKLLTPDLVTVTDPDSTDADIVITLVPASGNTVMPGHIENERFPGQVRNSFTLEDLSSGRVSFVHQVSNIMLALLESCMGY